MPTALIIGISGQDGALLAKSLVDSRYRVVGTSRDVEASSFANLHTLGIADKIELRSMNSLEMNSIIPVFRDLNPDEIYNLGGQTSVGLSFDQPSETLSSIVLATQNILESMRTVLPDAKFYSASSSECFGDTGSARANEQTHFHPRSPYAVAKACAFWQVASYREAYGLFAVSGILFNHESMFRPARFVTSKILHTALRISAGSRERLTLGDTSIVRDWGYAPEYVRAMQSMLQISSPADLVIASGTSMSLHTFAATAFETVGLELEEHLQIDPRLFRPNEISESRADPGRSTDVIGWQSTIKGPALIERLIEDIRRSGKL